MRQVCFQSRWIAASVDGPGSCQRDGGMNRAVALLPSTMLAIFGLAQAGVDNALALVDVAKADVVIVSGGSTGLNELVVRPEIKSYADIRGKRVVVDAPNTAFALILYKMLDLNGIKRGEYEVYPAGACSFRLNAMRADTNRVAAMMNPPCSNIAKRDGFPSFGMGTDVIGAYLADGHWVLRSWAKAN